MRKEETKEDTGKTSGKKKRAMTKKCELEKHLLDGCECVRACTIQAYTSNVFTTQYTIHSLQSHQKQSTFATYYSIHMNSALTYDWRIVRRIVEA